MDQPQHDNAGPAIEVVDLSRSYLQRQAPPLLALDGVSLTVEAGQTLALLGPNGSGKSTLMRLIATLDRPQSGAVRVLGDDPSTGPNAIRSIRSKIGVVFQQHGLDPLLTVEENLVNQAALFGIRGDDAKSMARHAAIDLGVADRLASRVGELSGGLARRVDLARALLHHPILLLLDEPTTGLDHQSRASFLDAIEQRRAVGTDSVILSTHLMDEAQRMDRVALLDQGKVVAEGTPASLCEQIGGLLVRTDASMSDELESAGLTVRIEHGEAVGAGATQVVLETAQRLSARAGAGDGVTHVHVGPPTLGDAYLSLTGSALVDHSGGTR